MLPLLADADPVTDVLPEALFRLRPFDLYFTNHMLMALIAAILVLLVFPTLFRAADSGVPSGARNFFEAILEFLRIEVFRPALKENTDRFLPFLWTLSFFILFCNLLGQIPFDALATLFTRTEHHFNVTATGSLETTGALALCTFFCIHAAGLLEVARSLINGTYGRHEPHQEHTSSGGKLHEAAHDLEHDRGEALAADVPSDFRALGDPTAHYTDDEYLSGKVPPPKTAHHELHSRGMNPVAAWILAGPLYLWNFAPHVFRPTEQQSPAWWIADLLLWVPLLGLELIGAVIKPFALMMRLFANMIAGHIVLAALIFLIPLGSGLAIQIGLGIPVTLMSLMIRLLELFVAFLQTYIFVFLSTMFIASAVAPEH